ncbi:MAG: right-handed parallel beta-helix repeat-containing protein [bacterium]
MLRNIKARLVLFIFTLLFLAFSMTAYATPDVSSIIPNTANNWGMTEITELTGSGFEEGATVILSKEGQLDILVDSTVMSSTMINGILDLEGEDPGTWDVTVTNPDGQSATLSAGFTLTLPPAPVITSNSPETEQNIGYVIVTITGENFNGSHVKLIREGYSDIDAVTVLVESSSQITCEFNLTGVETGHWNLMVINADGQTATSNSIDVIDSDGSEVFIVTSNTDFYVDAVNGSDALGDGSSANPWKTITYALNHISGSGINVYVAPGTYDPDLGESFPINMRNGISLIGSGAGSTILDAQEGTNKVIYGYRIIWTSTIIDGFTIKNGSVGVHLNNYSRPYISNCTITENQLAGGIYCSNRSDPLIYNCKIINNSTTILGGGIACTSKSNPRIINSNISNNTSEFGAGAIYSYFFSKPRITNCIINDNTSVSYGGGICSHWNSSIALINCTITGNSVPNGNGGGIWCRYASCSVINSIIWNNSALYGNEIYLDAYGSIGVSYSDVRWDSGIFPGTGNINGDPLFGADYHLLSGSPCIDAANSNDPAPIADKDGTPRYDDPYTPNTGTGVNGDFYDMGAYEYIGDNVPPVAVCQDITVQLDATGNVSITADQIDNGSTDNCGIGSMSVSPNTFTCTEVGPNSVTLTVTDINGNSSQCTATVTVEDNTSPAGQCQDIAVELDVTGNASITADQIDNGSTDNCGIDTMSVSPDTFTCAEVGPNTVTLTVTDINGNSSQCTATIMVEDNIEPLIEEISAPLDPIIVNSLVETSAKFIESCLAWAIWYWGDETSDYGTISSEIDEFGRRSVTGSHIYETAGVYTITLRITDDNEASGEIAFKYVVVYNPDGGFVTGGGWIDSVAGAYTPDPSLTGKANFGFVSKYKKGANIPTGETQFNFKVAHLNFHSESYDWLVVANSLAQYKGTGTINNEGNYGFILSVIDAEFTPSTEVDLFRIKIWDKDNEDNIVYDNQMGDADDADPATMIGAGSIVIHKPN